MEHNLIDKHVGAKLRVLRSELNLEIAHLAQMLDIDANKLHRYEAGIERICATELQRIAKALQVNATYFFHGLKGKNEIISTGNPEAKNVPVEEALELMRAFGGIDDPTVRKQLIDLVRSFASDPTA
ncbi:MAG: helix-turn-helix transcriptional regulator [Candidatus Pacebacteria bacterium]|nr:helix-turn-helix transcriptional regulator [Candidatus Paceibacterota bacterium]